MAVPVKVEGISKCFRINHTETHKGDYRTLRESIMKMVMSPLRNLAAGAALGDVEDFWALRDIDFEVEQGEAIGIVGSNGAGKSTLLKILTRITEPTSGRAILRGRVGSLLEVGTGFHPELTGRENVYLNGSILGMTRAEIASKFDQIVDFSGVEKFIDTPIKRYSSGMKVRLAFSVAAHLDLELLIIDEVLAVGDIDFQRKCLGRMQEVAGSGRTVLFVSHNMNAVSQLCNRALLLENGRVAALGNVDDVTGEYISRHRQLFGTASLEEWPAHRERGDVRFVNSLRINGKEMPGEVASQCGSGFHVELHIDTGEIDIRQIRQMVHFSTEDGLRILSLVTDFDEVCRCNVRGAAILRCDIESLPLIPGEYLIDTGMGSANGYAELFHRVGALRVFASQDTFPGGKVPRYKQQGYFSVPARWTVQQECNSTTIS